MDNLLDLLQQATITLSQNGSIKDRLADAYATHLIQVDVEALPESLRDEFECLCQAMRRERPLPEQRQIQHRARRPPLVHHERRQCERPQYQAPHRPL